MSVARALPSPMSDDRLLTHADGSRPRVLYAEDSTTSRIVTTALLRRMGLEVDAVEDGELALRQAEQQPYDVILLDIEMPIMDGVAAARCIRALESHRTTPILALSAFLADSTEHSLWRDAFDHALPKPANGNELHKALSRMLAASAAARKSVGAEPVLTVRPHMPGSLTSGLRAVLPSGSWSRLRHMAAMEGLHYANAALVALQSGDAATCKRCITALKSLAINFEAWGVADMAEEFLLQEELAVHEMTALHVATQSWQTTARSNL